MEAFDPGGVIDTQLLLRWNQQGVAETSAGLGRSIGHQDLCNPSRANLLAPTDSVKLHHRGTILLDRVHDRDSLDTLLALPR